MNAVESTFCMQDYWFFFFSLDILRNILLNTELLTVFFISRILTTKLHLSVILALPAKNW